VRGQPASGCVKSEFPACAGVPLEKPWSMLIASTTVANRPDAERLAHGAMTGGLAVCVQIEGPVTSHYRWEGRLEHAEEFRLSFKCLPRQLAPLERHVLATHPYDIPEWLVVRAEHVGEKYLSWAEANSSSAPL